MRSAAYVGTQRSCTKIWLLVVARAMYVDHDVIRAILGDGIRVGRSIDRRPL